MAITKIRRVPEQLPEAHLYLDDVEELSTILLDAVGDMFKPEDQPTVTFSVGDDLVMDAIADLSEHGGSATKFKINVGVGYATASIYFHSLMAPRVELGILYEHDQWRVYGKILAVFESRRFGLKNGFQRLPAWFKWSVPLAFLFFGVLSLKYLPPILIAHGAYIVVASLGFWILFGFSIFRPSRVSFVRSHERSKLTIESRKTLAKTIALLVVGAGVGAIVQHFVSLWFK